MGAYTRDLHAIVAHKEEARVLNIRAKRVKKSISKRKERYIKYYKSENPDPIKLKNLSNAYEKAMRLGWRIYPKCRSMRDIHRSRIDDDDRSVMVNHYLDFASYGIR